MWDQVYSQMRNASTWSEMMPINPSGQRVRKGTLMKLGDTHMLASWCGASSPVVAAFILSALMKGSCQKPIVKC